MAQLVFKNIYASIEGKKILKGLSFVVRSGEVHVIMGPNGSGKSTLAHIFAGHPSYKITNISSQIILGKSNMLRLSPEARAKAGLFLAFQSPIAIPGVSVVNLLRTAYQDMHATKTLKKKDVTAMHNPAFARRWVGTMSITDFMAKLKKSCTILKLPETFLQRNVNDGFSGGEKKKVEMLQALVLAPKFAVFDEIDTGLDVDALRVVAKGIEVLKQQGTGIIIITHYQRILQYIHPDIVHIFVAGKIVKTGDVALAEEIEEKGYAAYV